MGWTVYAIADRQSPYYNHHITSRSKNPLTVTALSAGTKFDLTELSL